MMDLQNEKNDSKSLKSEYIKGMFALLAACIAGVFLILNTMVDKDIINFKTSSQNPTPTSDYPFETAAPPIQLSSFDNQPFIPPPTISSVYFTENDIDNAIGKGYWRCIDGSPKSISIDRVPYNYVVSSPFTRIDTDGNFYEVGEYVSGGNLGTGWLVGDLPNFSCSSVKPQVNFEIINRFLGNGKWKCVGVNQPSGVDLLVVPSNFIVQSPINFVDSKSKRYYQGDEVPAGNFARVWFANDIPQNECP